MGNHNANAAFDFGEVNMTKENAHTPIRYPSDLSDEEWAIIEAILNELEPYKTGDLVKWIFARC
ncbi:hypothetical protein CKO25_00420 [Thiocapsa imhoffii]|uniref:Uncharacterized protein n=1 Tax=Thiocapsa imhoffii TaxID=382777 RepID=A0A9X0WE93_9GAMM|nr:hypothetical protein [Thiocapsa imhoffii]